MKSPVLLTVYSDILVCSNTPNWIIEQTIEKVKNQNEMPRSTQLKTNTEENEHLLMLPYKSKVGETTLKSLRNTCLSYQQITRAKLSILERI